MEGDRFLIKGLEAQCILGAYDWGRKTPRSVCIDLEFPAEDGGWGESRAVPSWITRSWRRPLRHRSRRATRIAWDIVTQIRLLSWSKFLRSSLPPELLASSSFS